MTTMSKNKGWAVRPSDLTKSQRDVIRYLIRNFIRRCSGVDILYNGYSEQYKNTCLHAYEYKHLQVKRLDAGSNTIVIFLEVGKKYDEHTMSHVFCRQSINFFIGPRGGVDCYVYSSKNGKSKRVRGLSRCLALGVR